MKRERMTFSLCSMAVIMASVISFSAIMCLVEAFGLHCRPRELILICCVISGLAVLVMSLRYSWIYSCCFFGLYLFVLIWQNGQIIAEFETFLYHVTEEYAKCFQVVVLGVPHGEIRLLLPAIAALLAWLCAWVICREGSTAIVLLACAPIFVLCLIVVDIAPDLWLVLLTGALLLVILTGSVRGGNSNEGGRLLWWLSAPVMILVFFLTIVSPKDEYVRSDWSENLQTVAEGNFDLKLWEKRVSTVIGSDWSREQKTVNLKTVGPQIKTGEFALSYQSEREISYLRGTSYGLYQENQWKPVELPWSLTVDGVQLVRPSQTPASVHIQTRSAHPVYYTAYYPTELPEAGLAVEDSFIKNEDRRKEYSVSYDAAGTPTISPEYEAFVLETYTQLPEELQELLEQILQQAGLAGSSAEAICAYVKNSAVYDLNTAAAPAGADFVLHFLQESRQGYCTHFASAAVLLMRSAGIPARYVTGYSVSGAAGQWNDVTEDDAHAWAEYYLQGVGWIPVDPTPASRQEEQETPPVEEEVKLPQEPEQEPPQMSLPDDTGAEGQPAHQTVASGNPLRWLLLLPVLVLFIAARRWAILYCRRVRLKKAKPNRKTLLLWERLVRLHKACGTAVPEQWICLAEKAKFSNHIITDEELQAICAAVDAQIDNIAKRPILYHLWYRYGLVLY